MNGSAVWVHVGEDKDRQVTCEALVRLHLVAVALVTFTEVRVVGELGLYADMAP